jgi:hypothetical protein
LAAGAPRGGADNADMNATASESCEGLFAFSRRDPHVFAGSDSGA